MCERERESQMKIYGNKNSAGKFISICNSYVTRYKICN